MAIILASVDKEYKKNSQLTESSFSNVKQWVDMQPHLPKISDLDVILFLHSCLYSTEKTKQVIDTYFTVRTHVPEFFANRDPQHPTIAKTMDVITYIVLPEKTPKSEQVFIAKLHNTDPSLYNLADALKLFCNLSDLALHEDGTSFGHRIVFDMDGVVFGHLARLGILTIKKFLYYLQEAMPIHLTGLHFINVVPFMDKILALMRPFMKQELMSMLYLHTDGMESFYKFVPQAIMPADYGGKAPKFSELRKRTIDKINSNKTFFAEEEKLRVNESLRPGKAKTVNDIFGVEGSFKKLEID